MSLFEYDEAEEAADAGRRFGGAGMKVFPVDMRPDENGQACKQPLYGYLWKQRATSIVPEIEEDIADAERDIGAEFVGLAWAVGQDGCMAVDLDGEEPDWWPKLGDTAVNVTKRGEHRVFRQPDGRRIGNGTTRFPSQGWGEVRGDGGYIIVWWPGDRPGFDVAELARVATFPHPDWLTDAGADAEAVSFAERDQFIAERTDGRLGPVKGFETALRARVPGVSRHDHAVIVACWIVREAAAGLVPAAEAFEVLETWWTEAGKAVEYDTNGRRKTRRLTLREVRSIECWAIGQLTPERIAEVRAKADADDAAWQAEQEEALNAMIANAPGAAVVDIGDAVDWADSHLGELLAEELRTSWLYVTAWRCWKRWDGRRWTDDKTEAVHEVARRWMLTLGGQALANVTKHSDPLLRKVLEYRRASAMENVVKVARRILAVDPAVFDHHAHLLNVANGVVDLRTGRLGPHDPALMMTRLAGAAYDPEATHPDVAAVFGCLDPGDVDSVRMLLGVAASGHTGGDHLPVFDGGGSNGKTTLLLAASAALGDYAGPVPPELVMKSSREDHPTIKTTLHGLRMGSIEETEEEGGLRLERVKAITGGGVMNGRRIGGDYYSWEPTHTLVLATNHRPNVNSAEHAAWRRLHLVPFPHRYGTANGDRAIDAGLRDRLRLGPRQREAMLAVIIAGARAAYAAGAPESPVVLWSAGIDAATDAWRQDEDVISRFAATELCFDPGARVTLKDMFAAYRFWCEAGGRIAGQDKLFARRFEAHDVARGVKRTTPQRRVTYVGVGLR